jgi:transcription elongation factor GreA
MPTTDAAPPTAATLLREVGLLADGPVPWGRPVPARGPGVFVIELPAPLPRAPLELSRIGKWLERVPELRLDGSRPTTKALAARIGSFWLPGQVVLYIGASSGSVGGRILAMEQTVLGDRRPASSGAWLKTLRDLPLRVWWAATDAIEEYEDALLTAFEAAVGADERAALSAEASEPLLPFANLRRPTGERRRTGITGSLLPEPVTPPAPPTRIVQVPDGDAEGARGEPPERKRRTVVAQPAPEPIRRAPTRTQLSRAAAAGDQTGTALTADGDARLRAELQELTQVRRPEVIARIRAAKELGDLKENADYTAAREEQSFLEGRIQALEARLRDAVVVDAPVAGSGANLGSKVTVEADGLEDTYTLVSTAEANPAEGRVSIVSPVGQALVGAVAGAEVTVHTPRGPVRYRVTAVD